MDELKGGVHGELRENVGLHLRRGRGGERNHGSGIMRAAQRWQMLAEHAVIGPEVVAPLRDAMRLVNSDERELALGKHLNKARHAEPLRRDEKELQCTLQILDAGLALRGAIETGVNAGYAQPERRELGGLVFHERDERRNDERRAAARDGGQLITEALPCPGRHHQQQVAACDGGAAHFLLPWAKAGKAKHALQ